MFAIMDVIKGIKMYEQILFGRKSRCISKYSLLQVFQLLLVCPCFMIHNPLNIFGSLLHKIRFRYVLSDSWFTCAKIVKFVRSLHIKCDYIEMIKVGEEGKTRYHFERKDLTDPSIIMEQNKRGEKKYNCKLRRWSQEFIFKESKGLLGLRKCQSANFAAQIASTSLVTLQYNILSAVKRFMDNEIIGELFRQINQDSHELTISERISQAILELVVAITKVLSISDEEVMDVLVNESDELAHICELYQCKLIS